MFNKSRFITLAGILAMSAIVIGLYLHGNADERAKWIASGVPSVGQVVYADRNIPEDHVIERQDVVELPFSPDKIPTGCLLCENFVVGARTKFAVSFGQILCAHDLIPIDRNRAELQGARVKECSKDRSAFCPHPKGNLLEPLRSRTFVACKDVAQGAIVNISALQKKTTENSANDSVHHLWQIVGRPSKYGLHLGDTISVHDVDHESESPVFVLVTSKHIRQGAEVTPALVRKVLVRASQCPGTALAERELMAGCVAHVDIPEGTMLRAGLLDSERPSKGSSKTPRVSW